MRRAIALVMLIVTVGIALYLHMKQTQGVTTIDSNPQTTIDVTAVRNDLGAIANAERNSFASNGKYVSLDELRTGGDLTIPTRPNYSYSAEWTENTSRLWRPVPVLTQRRLSAFDLQLLG